MSLHSLIEKALQQPRDAILFYLSKGLSEAFPDRHLLETDSWAFKLRQFECDGHCRLQIKEDTHPQWDWDWDNLHRQDYAEERAVWFEVEWQGKQLDALVVSYMGHHSVEQRWYVLADSEETNRAFFQAVAEWTSEVRGEVLVFDGGCWQKSKQLFESIQTASWGNLILEGDLKQEIREDLEGFFKSKDVYQRYGIAWKRGVLFLGPPGNGKTHAVKSIVGSIGYPALYVKSFKAEYQTAHKLIGNVFSRARSSAPCILVLEDLDALIDEENRSFFLNELDGFASNDGILTIGTTNHPERLDPAILERPSRFDRKYTFGLPESDERGRFLSLFASRLEPALQLDERGLEEVVASTEGYSFAYLKELYLSAMMRWIANPEKMPIAALMIEQSDALRAQMATDPGETSSNGDGEMPGMAQMAAYMRRWRRK